MSALNAKTDRDRAARETTRAARLSLPVLFAVCVLAIAGALILGSVPRTAHADTFEGATAVVLYDNTHRYTEPTGWSERIDTVDAGMIVTVSSIDDVWCTGTTASGQTYCMLSSHVRVMTEPNPAPGEGRPVLKGVACGTVTGRTAPDDESPQAMTFGEGQVLQFNKYCDGWYMAYGMVDGQRRLVFVSGEGLGMLDMSQDTPDRPTYRMQLTAQPTKLRKSPSTSGSVVSTMDKGAIVTLSRFNDDWYMATFSGTLCYIAATDVTDKVVEPKPVATGPTRTVNYTSYALTLAKAVSIQMSEGNPRQSTGAVASSSQVSSAMNPAS